MDKLGKILISTGYMLHYILIGGTTILEKFNNFVFCIINLLCVLLFFNPTLFNFFSISDYQDSDIKLSNKWVGLSRVDCNMAVLKLKNNPFHKPVYKSNRFPTPSQKRLWFTNLS
ncbi:hypothetical protein BpHYR1_030403 [Brachionus plicatilis]|uniref:Uncharacterized protein n=1 Tax=Brachionus plicatilis TaxID=10195 RepID=A0A3M7T2L0_BRAPC|nr:hypothetical protein BpHYR1_030403 [Brachionus plicatilis]